MLIRWRLAVLCAYPFLHSSCSPDLRQNGLLLTPWVGTIVGNGLEFQVTLLMTPLHLDTSLTAFVCLIKLATLS